MPDSKALEKSAAIVLQHHNREVTGATVCSALDNFLALAEVFAVTDWKNVEKHLKRLIRPILDNNYAFQTMRAIREHYAHPEISYSAEFSWAPRGLLMYGLSAGLRKCEDDQPDNLPPRVILQWLGRLSKDEAQRSLQNSTCIVNTASAITHAVFSLWSCRYDADVKGRKIKILIALRKLNQINTDQLKRDVFDTEPGPRLYANLLILMDYYWLRSWARLANAGYLPQFAERVEVAQMSELPNIVTALIQDFENLKAPPSSQPWVEQKFSIFALEILENVATLPAKDWAVDSRKNADDAFVLLFNKFLVQNPRSALEAARLYRSCCGMPLSAHVCAAIYQSLSARYNDLPLLTCFILATDNIPFIDARLHGRSTEILNSQLTEADVSGIILATGRLAEASNWRTAFFGDLKLLQLSEANPGRLTWLMVGRQLGVPVNVQGIMDLWHGIVAECHEPDWYAKSLTRDRELVLELLTLTATDVLLGGQLTNTEFDGQALELHETLSRMLARTERGQERTALLCLCLSIYLGNPQTTTLMSRLSIRAIQSYSLAWCLDGLERLWKTNLWTTPRQTCESAERVRAQSGSVALLTLDAGSLQSMVTQIEGSAPAINSLVSTAREYSAAVDAIVEKRPGWERAAAKLLNLKHGELLERGDFTPLLGAPRDYKLSKASCAASGLAALARRLLGYHLCAVSNCSEKLSFPTIAHVYLERKLHGDYVAPEMRSAVRRLADANLLESGESVIMTARAAL